MKTFDYKKITREIFCIWRGLVFLEKMRILLRFHGDTYSLPTCLLESSRARQLASLAYRLENGGNFSKVHW